MYQSSNQIAVVSKSHYNNSFLKKIKKYNSLDLMMEHRCSQKCSTWAYTCMHITSIIGFGHCSPPPLSALATAHQSTTAHKRAPPPQSPSRLLPACANYLPNPRWPPTAHTRGLVSMFKISQCALVFK
jgi:hypothetical protein